MERVPSVNINSATWVASLVSYFHRSGVIYPRLAGFSIWSVGSLPNCIYLLKTISNLSTVYRGDRGSPYRIFESLHSEHNLAPSTGRFCVFKRNSCFCLLLNTNCFSSLCGGLMVNRIRTPSDANIWQPWGFTDPIQICSKTPLGQQRRWFLGLKVKRICQRALITVGDYNWTCVATWPWACRDTCPREGKGAAAMSFRAWFALSIGAAVLSRGNFWTI